MHAKTLWLFGLLTLAYALVPAAAYAQFNVPPMDPMLPLPIFNSRPEMGGFFIAGEGLLFQQDNPIKPQEIAVYGIKDMDGSITNTKDKDGNIITGKFLGSGKVALDAANVNRSDYFPGFNLAGGYRFENGTAIELNWMHLQTAQNGYSPPPPPFNIGNTKDWANAYLTAPVVNFPGEYAGPPQKIVLPNNYATYGIGLPNNYATYGIWNAATCMHISFQQKFDQFDLQYRQPIIEEAAYRWYGILGAKMVYIRERFDWTTVDTDTSGNTTPDDIANYTNKVVNHIFGPRLGWGNEYYLGHGFALTIDLEGALMLDVVKEFAEYSLACDCPHPVALYDRTTYTIVPELEAKLNIWWYPIEGVQVRIGYDAMLFYNTVASRHPVAFDFNNFEPSYSRAVRFLQGFNIGIGFIF